MTAGEVLESFRLHGNVYVLGCFEKGLTIYTAADARDADSAVCELTAN
jgi:hypothetical protein